MPTGDIARVVALGASNLTRGLQTVVASAATAWGPGVQVLAALGHGRSYGAASSLLVRRLPGILQCGLWTQLESQPELPTRALVTDVGNDILYGFSAQQTLEWVGESVHRLRRVTSDIVVAGLPVDGIRGLSQARFLFFRSLFVPSCRLSLEQVLETSVQVNAGLGQLADSCGARFVRLEPQWYGLDPIHFRPDAWRTAWQEILGVAPATVRGGHVWEEALRLYFMPPQRRWLLGFEQVTPQRGAAMASGARVWLY